ncbi:MOSC domain-containing protein [Sphingomonas sp. GB1N7]|uniref:MOSC domain-containing protein n=1 Tax=Parasphingomonas caseinilytica TaxID=3096158 RepID=UPI002FCB8EBC
MSGDEQEQARVIAVAADGEHHFAKPRRDAIRLVAGLGVEGDAHLGVTVQHLSRKAKDPSVPNLRQVHLIHGELFDDLAARGFMVEPGELGENVTTRGIALLDLPEDTLLALGDEAIVRVTGLRNPCVQIDRFQKGLMAATLDRAADGSLIRKAGVMAVVVTGGVVRAGDMVRVELPPGLSRPLQVV